LSETRTARRVTKAATRSSPEWAASARMPRLPVKRPTTSFIRVRKRAAKTEFRAADLFSRSTARLTKGDSGNIFVG
jgi:hypothetical protein